MTKGQKIMTVVLVTLGILSTLVIVIPLTLSLLNLFIPVYASLEVWPKQLVYAVMTFVVLCVFYLSCYVSKIIYDPLFPYLSERNKGKYKK